MSINPWQTMAVALTHTPRPDMWVALYPIVVLWLALPAAVLAIAWIGPFRLDRARRRVGEGDSRSLLLLILASGGFINLFVQMAYLQAKGVTNANAIPPADLVIVSILSDVLAGAVMIYMTFAMRHDGLARVGISWRHARASLGQAPAYLVLAYPLVILASAATEYVWSRINGGAPGEHELIKILQEHPSRSLQWLIVVSAVVAAPMAEELFFRGYLQTFVRELPVPPWMAILFSSLAFTLIHQPPEIQPMIFVLALALGYVYERTGNLTTTMLMHAAFNGTNIYLALHPR
jgi:membrane protease YdiL (CAAX protease family)